MLYFEKSEEVATSCKSTTNPIKGSSLRKPPKANLGLGHISEMSKLVDHVGNLAHDLSTSLGQWKTDRLPIKAQHTKSDHIKGAIPENKSTQPKALS